MNVPTSVLIVYRAYQAARHARDAAHRAFDLALDLAEKPGDADAELNALHQAREACESARKAPVSQWQAFCHSIHSSGSGSSQWFFTREEAEAALRDVLDNAHADCEWDTWDGAVFHRTVPAEDIFLD